MKWLQEEETHVDETHAGTVLATIYALQKKRDELREEVNTSIRGRECPVTGSMGEG